MKKDRNRAKALTDSRVPTVKSTVSLKACGFFLKFIFGVRSHHTAAFGQLTVGLLTTSVLSITVTHRTQYGDSWIHMLLNAAISMVKSGPL
jgi:hypothetical protein